MRLSVAFLASHLLSILGNAVAAIALPLIILQTTGSALGAGAVAASTAIPALVVGIVMGIVIDRVNRRTASILADLISGVSVAALPLIDLFTDLNIGLFVLFGIIGSVGDIPGMTARETLLPAIVKLGAIPAERLIGLREALGAVGLVVGPAVAGFLLGVFETSAVLWITAGLSFSAAAITMFLPRSVGDISADTPSTSKNPLRELREGWKTLFGTPFLVILLVMTMVAGIVTSSFQGLILPVYFTAINQPALLGLVLSALATGMLLGSGVYAVFSKAGKHRRAWLSTGLAGATIGIAVMATLASVPVIVIGAFITGATAGLFTSITGVLMLERIPDHVRGRVLSTQNAAVTLAPSFGVFTAAIITETLGLHYAAILAAIIWAAMAVGVLLAKPMRDLAPPATELISTSNDAKKSMTDR
jgi:MFS family permease